MSKTYPPLAYRTEREATRSSESAAVEVATDEARPKSHIVSIARALIESRPGTMDLRAIEDEVDWSCSTTADQEMWHFLTDVEGVRADLDTGTTADVTDRMREELEAYERT